MKDTPEQFHTYLSETAANSPTERTLETD